MYCFFYIVYWIESLSLQNMNTIFQKKDDKLSIYEAGQRKSAEKNWENRKQ